MGWETEHFVQLIIALVAGIMLFMAAYALPARIVMWVLLLLIPFQFINSKYGSLNLVLTYMVGAIFIIHGRIVSLPLIGIVTFIMFTYLLAFSQSPPGTNMDHGLYIVSFMSNFMMFYIVYNFVRTSGNYKVMWNILATLNVLVLLYCGLEMAAGSAGIRFFGLSELEISSGRAEEGYLIGPFRAIAMTAEYIAIQSLISIYALMRPGGVRYRIFWGMLLAGNLGVLIAVGSRGGVVALVVGLVVFLVLFRKELGIVKIMTGIVSGALVFMAAAYVIMQYTPYNILFDKLAGTEFVDGVPDSRQGWFDIWDQVIEKPVIGHGPRLRLNNEGRRKIPGYTPIPYPHSAPLYLIFTVGLVGLSAYVWFFSALARQYWRGGRNRAEDPLLSGLPLLGLAVLSVFAASEIRMEMFRFHLHAYQQYLFMLIGAFLAFSHMALEQKPEKVEESRNHDKGRLLSRRGESGENVPRGN